MGVDDNVSYRLFYGIYTYNWFENFGTFSIHRYLLVDDYISEGCDTLDSSEASNIRDFLYPQLIKKTYHLEGKTIGHITMAASGCTSTITDYTVEVWKMNEDNSSEMLATTGTVIVNDTLAWNAGLSVGEEMVYPFWIDVSIEQKLTEHDRIFIRIYATCNNCTHLMFSNDSTWEDLKVDLPFRL